MAPQPLPPNAIDAEKAVLGALLVNGDMRYRVAGIIQPGDFYLKRHEHIYRTLLSLNGEGTDILIVSDALEAAGHLDECGGQSYLSELVEACVWSANAEQYAAIVAERAQRRRLVTAAQTITQKAYDLDSNDPLSLAHRLIMDIPARNNGGGLVDMNAAVGTLYDQVEAWAQSPLDFGEVRGLATEIPSLDQLLGGLQPGWLVLICARPMIGKSALAFEIARRNAEKGKRVAIFSLEMPRNDILLRWASCLSGVETRKVRRGPCPEKYRGTPSATAYLTQQELSAYIEAMGQIAAYPSMWIDDTGALSALDIRARAIRLAHQADGLDLIIVDHSGLMIGDGQNGEGVSKVEGRKSNAMRALAKEIGCPVILIQQLNRASEARNDKHPSLSDLRDCVTGDTDVVDAATGAWVPISTVVPGQVIQAYHRATMKTVPATVTEVFEKGEQQVYEVTTKSGRRIKATINHPFLTANGWKQLGELRPGDRIASVLQLHDPAEPSLKDGDLCRLLGYMVGDGSYQHNRGISFISSDRATFDDAIQIVKDNFPQISFRIENGQRKHPYWEVDFSQVDANGHGKPGGNTLRSWLLDLGIEGQTCIDKRVPSFVFGCGHEGAAQFIAGYLASDGCIKRKLCRGRPLWEVHFDSVCEPLAHDVQRLLMRLGVVATIDKPSIKGRYRPIYRLRVSSGADNLRQFGHVARGYGRKRMMIDQMLAELGDTVGKEMLGLPLSISERACLVSKNEWRNVHRTISRERARRLAVKYGDPELLKWATSDVFWEPIVSCEPLGIQPTWDIRVPATGCFVANGLVVHNSGEHEQNAHVVIGLYRESAYKQMLPGTVDDLSLEALTLKHREGPSGKRVTLRYERNLHRFSEFMKGVNQ